MLGCTEYWDACLGVWVHMIGPGIWTLPVPLGLCYLLCSAGHLVLRKQDDSVFWYRKTRRYFVLPKKETDRCHRASLQEELRHSADGVKSDISKPAFMPRHLNMCSDETNWIQIWKYNINCYTFCRLLLILVIKWPLTRTKGGLHWCGHLNAIIVCQILIIDQFTPISHNCLRRRWQSPWWHDKLTDTGLFWESGRLSRSRETLLLLKVLVRCVWVYSMKWE